MELLDPSGASWRVRRRWLPWRPRRRDPDAGDLLDGGMNVDLGSDDLVSGLVIALVVVVLLLLVPWLVIGVVLVVETIAVLLLVPVAVASRALRVRGWPIQVERRSGRTWVRVLVERRRGWSASRHRMEELRDEIRNGQYPGPRYLV